MTISSCDGGCCAVGGVDIEPDGSDQRVVNVRFERCRSAGNRGAQYQFYAAQLNGASPNTSVTFVDCVAEGGAAGAPPTDPRNASVPWASPGWFFGNFENGMKGEVLLERCATRDTWDWGLHLRYIQPERVAIRVAESSFERCARRPTLRQTESIVGLSNDTWPTAAIAVLGAELYPPSGGLRQDSVRVLDDAQRPWLDVSAAAPGGVSGTASVKSGAGCSIRGGSASSVVTKCETATPSASAEDGSYDDSGPSLRLKTDGFEAVFGDVQQIGAAPKNRTGVDGHWWMPFPLFRAGASMSSELIVAVTIAGDGATCPPPERPHQPCAVGFHRAHQRSAPWTTNPAGTLAGNSLIRLNSTMSRGFSALWLNASTNTSGQM